MEYIKKKAFNLMIYLYSINVFARKCFLVSKSNIILLVDQNSPVKIQN